MREQEAEKQEAPALNNLIFKHLQGLRISRKSTKMVFTRSGQVFENDKQIKAEGIAGDSDQYYNELDNRIREYFPSHFLILKISLLRM